MIYQLETSNQFEKSFRKLDQSVQKVIAKWIHKHLENCENPRAFGKGLTANKSGYWRYRIGDYRLIVEIHDNELIIIAVAIAHRREVYR